MTIKQSKSKQITLGILTATMAVSPLASFAVNVNESGKGEVEIKHQVPLKGTNVDGKLTKPNQTLEIYVDKSNDSFKNIRQQLEKESFGILIEADNGEQIFLNAESDGVSYNKQDGTITIEEHEEFARFTSYVATVLVKSEFQQALKGKLPHFTKGLTVSFQTGSAVGEAVNVKSTIENKSVSVTDTNYLNVNVTDSYGNPSTDATLTVTGHGTGNKRVASTFLAKRTLAITNGTAKVPLNDHSANTVELAYEVQDNNHSDAVNVIKDTETIEFLPGHAEKAKIDLPSQLKVGDNVNVTGELLDTFGNGVNENFVVSGSLTGTLNANEDGDLQGVLKVNDSGAVTGMVNGERVQLASMTGEEIATITAEEVNKKPLIEKTATGIKYSTDNGQTWKDVYLNYKMVDFIYDEVNEVYLASAQLSPRSMNKTNIYTSEDGITWKLKTSVFGEIEGMATDNNGTIVFYGGWELVRESIILTTTDGGKTVNKTFNEFDFIGNIKNMTWDGKKFIASGKSVEFLVNRTYTIFSTDGINWTTDKPVRPPLTLI